MREWIARALRNPNARITGAVYLLYFLTAISGSLLAVLAAAESHRQPDLNRALYRIDSAPLLLFKPVNKSLCLLAALFSLAGCAMLLPSLIALPLTSARWHSSGLFGSCSAT